MARPFKNHPAAYWQQGVSAITVEDTRWSRCDIKSIALLPNVLANQQAREAGAFEALFVRDHAVIEGSHSNLFGVLDDALITYPSSGHILTGITRLLVLEKARELGWAVREGPIPMARLSDVQELFLSGTTTEVMPVVRVNGSPIAGGQPGPITRGLQELFPAWVAADQAAVSAGHGADRARRAS
jgi:D-alanine transaminase